MLILWKSVHCAVCFNAVKSENNLTILWHMMFRNLWTVEHRSALKTSLVRHRWTGHKCCWLRHCKVI